MIAFGALCNLVALNLNEKFLGSLLFSFGLFFVFMFELKLFTGMIANALEMKFKDWYQLLICFIFNALGIFFICLIAENTIIKDAIISRSISIMNSKFDAGYFSAFFSSILCGMTITIAVKGYQNASSRNLSSNIAVILPVIVFVYLGLDHSVANWAYIYLSDSWSIKMLIYVLITIIGNLIGGIFIPLCYKLIK